MGVGKLKAVTNDPSILSSVVRVHELPPSRVWRNSGTDLVRPKTTEREREREYIYMCVCVFVDVSVTHTSS